MQLRWIASHSASCLHAVEALARGLPIVDERLHTQIVEPANALCREIAAAALPVSLFLRHLVPLAAGIENNQQLAEVTMKKTAATDANSAATTRIASRIGDLEVAMRRAYPHLVDELSLRAAPLREQWEARGPGLLQHAARLTDERLLVPNADVILVQPAVGGDGAAHLPYNSVRIEAVLANPVSQIPEVVRLGWFLTQLNCDLPVFSETIAADRLPLVTQLALLPVALAAGEYVELTHCDATTIDLAMKVWHVAVPPDRNQADVIVEWWETYRESKPRWDVALGALDRMIS